MDFLNKQNEKLTKKLLKLSKKMQEISADNQQHIEALERDLAKKAEKESLLESQQKFFDNLAKIEAETGQSLSKLVEEELIKISQ